MDTSTDKAPSKKWTWTQQPRVTWVTGAPGASAGGRESPILSDRASTGPTRGICWARVPPSEPRGLGPRWTGKGHATRAVPGRIWRGSPSGPGSSGSRTPRASSCAAPGRSRSPSRPAQGGGWGSVLRCWGGGTPTGVGLPRQEQTPVTRVTPEKGSKEQSVCPVTVLCTRCGETTPFWHPGLFGDHSGQDSSVLRTLE